MRQKAFSLLEILIVIAVLAILVAIGLYVSSGSSTSSPLTQVELRTLKDLMVDYEGHNAPFTTAANTDPTRSWLAPLRADTKNASQLATLKLSADKSQILDPFGTPIRFLPADASPDKHFHFQSVGPDTKFDTPDDIFSD
jgi:prepilin-type N-terminal cleavage/methylation domain-containing protein